MLAATKWDAFRGRAAEQQRALGLALRCLAHANGAHLAYLGGLQPGGGAGAEGGSVAAESLPTGSPGTHTHTRGCGVAVLLLCGEMVHALSLMS